MTIFLIIVFCFVAVGIWVIVESTKAKTPVGRIENLKKFVQSRLRKEWRDTRALGSSEDVRDWVKRKLPLIDDDWLEKNQTGLNDEQLIERGVNYIYSHPRMIEHLLKKDSEERMGELEEQSAE